MISYLGKGLNITISCDHVPGHNWMSYICYYSIKQNLPDANVNILCKRDNVTGNLFLWTKKLGVPFRMCNEESFANNISRQNKPSLIIPPYCVAVRDFEESGFKFDEVPEDYFKFLEETDLVCDARADGFCSFCNYKNGWGHFITEDWINKVECPLSTSILKRFSKKIMSLNERRVESLWNASLKLFQAVSGGVIYETI